jgi:type IV secretion system protein VirD4
MSERKKAFLWLIGLCVIAIALAIFLLWLSGMNPFNARHWRAILKFIWEKKTLPDYWSYGIGGWLTLIIMGIALNPYRFDKTTYGSANWAKFSDLGRFKPTVLAKTGIVLGKVGGKIMKSNEPLTTWVVAPAGTGKTAGVIVPTIISCPHDSLFINDPKGELYDLTAKERQKVGEVYRIEWSAGAAKSSCWNPIDIKNLPKDENLRGNLIDSLVPILVPMDEKSGDKFFPASAQDALSAILLFLIYEGERLGRQHSIADVLEWLSESSRGEKNEDQNSADEVTIHLKKAADTAEQYYYPKRIAQTMRVFGDLDHKTRSNIFSTITTNLKAFRNSNVVEVTSSTNFNLEWFRDKNGKPITVYVVTPALDQEIFGKITGLLVESATRYLTGPKQTQSKRTVRFILDEAGFLPVSKTVIESPAITRGYKVSFLFSFQDYGQVISKWGQSALENLKTNTAYTIVLTQNNLGTATELSARIGKTTRDRQSKSWTSGSLIKKKNVSSSEEGVPLMRAEEIMSMKRGQQIVLVQNNANRPIMCQSAYSLTEKLNHG